MTFLDKVDDYNRTVLYQNMEHMDQATVNKQTVASSGKEVRCKMWDLQFIPRIMYMVNV